MKVCIGKNSNQHFSLNFDIFACIFLGEAGRYKSIEIDHRKLIDYSILLDNTR